MSEAPINTKFFVGTCLAVVAVCGLFLLNRPKPAEQAPYVLSADGKPVTHNPTVAQERQQDTDATFEQTPESTCIISDPRILKQYDGSVLARFIVTAVDPGPQATLHVEVEAPNVAMVGLNNALQVTGQAPDIFNSTSNLQAGAASAEIHPAKGKYEITSRLAQPAKMVLDCKVI